MSAFAQDYALERGRTTCVGGVLPENVVAMYYLAFNLRYLEEYDETIEWLDRALRIDPLDQAALPGAVL